MEPHDPKIVYRLMQPGEEAAAARLALEVFLECVAPHYAPEGIDAFRRFVHADALARRRQTGNPVLVAERGRRIVGLLEIRSDSHIAMLFVARHLQGGGIARELLQRAVALCRARIAFLQKITVNASPNSLAAYRKLGFQATGDETTVDGIRFTPMARTLAK